VDFFPLPITSLLTIRDNPRYTVFFFSPLPFFPFHRRAMGATSGSPPALLSFSLLPYFFLFNSLGDGSPPFTVPFHPPSPSPPPLFALSSPFSPLLFLTSHPISLSFFPFLFLLSISPSSPTPCHVPPPLPLPTHCPVPIRLSLPHCFIPSVPTLTPLPFPTPFLFSLPLYTAPPPPSLTILLASSLFTTFFLPLLPPLRPPPLLPPPPPQYSLRLLLPPSPPLPPTVPGCLSTIFFSWPSLPRRSRRVCSCLSSGCSHCPVYRARFSSSSLQLVAPPSPPCFGLPSVETKPACSVSHSVDGSGILLFFLPGAPWPTALSGCL